MDRVLGRLGFACNWDLDRTRTWSGTNWALYSALTRQIDTVDVGTRLTSPERRAWQMATRRRRNGMWVSTWETTRAWERYLLRDVQKRIASSNSDAVLEIQDIGVVDRPFFIYQDLSYDVLLRELATGSSGVSHFFKSLDHDVIQRRRERQHGVFARSAGVLAMSQAYAQSLIVETGLPPEKVHVVYPGATATSGQNRPRRIRDQPRTKLLFVGTSFLVKSGDVVVEAFKLLRRENPALTLTIVGPKSWPLETSIPEGVTFRGRVHRQQIVPIMDAHDLFVMPSRLEGFGMVFVEALARGLPCIGRRAFAMPELIDDGVTGAIVDSLDPKDVAEAIRRTLASDEIYAEVERQADQVATRFSWDQTAARVIKIIGDSISSV
jgi:glycosyltransferase involved in cell wall biosynthesis